MILDDSAIILWFYSLIFLSISGPLYLSFSLSFKPTSERVAHRCDNTVDKKRVNFWVLKNFLFEMFLREFSDQKNRQ